MTSRLIAGRLKFQASGQGEQHPFCNVYCVVANALKVFCRTLRCPRQKTYEGRSASVVGGEDIAVFSTSEQKDAAYEFAKFMTSEEVQLAMLQSGQLPILKSLVENEAVTSNPVWSVYMKQMESAKARIPSPNNSAIQEIWSEMVTSIFVDGADAAQAMHDAAARIDEQLA